VYNISYILLPLCSVSSCKSHHIIPQQWYKFSSPVLHQHFISITSHQGNFVQLTLHKEKVMQMNYQPLQHAASCLMTTILGTLSCCQSVQTNASNTQQHGLYKRYVWNVYVL